MKRGAFSLIELMIVIVIIGVIYTLAVTNIHKAPLAEEKKISLENLKSFLLALSKEQQSVSLLCKDSCQECAIYMQGERVQGVELFSDGEPTLYRYDFFLGPVKIESENCFSLSVNAEGVSDQVMVVYKNRVYDYTSYFQPVKIYDSLSEAVNAKEKTIEAVE